MRLLVPTVRHTGTLYLLGLLGDYSELNYSCDGFKRRGGEIIFGHFDEWRAPRLIEMSHEIKTVIPLRHPALVAVSWKKRNEASFLDQWLRMCKVEDAFYFPMETKPFDALERFTGVKIDRTDKPVNSLGDYPEKKGLETSKDFLGGEWADVETALDTHVGRRFYGGSDLCRL